MPSSQTRKCPDCKTVMHGIRLIDKTHGGRHSDLEYTLPDAQRSLWFGLFPVEGIVKAYMCDRCGRILLFGESGAPEAQV
jgi:hypothetical protein